METKIFEFFSPEFFRTVGMVVVFVAVIFGKDFITKWRYSNGHDRRRIVTEPDWFERFIEVHNNMTQKITEFTETVSKMSESMSKRADKAMEQHNEILKEIKELDIPRKR